MINSDRLTVPSWLENTNGFESFRLAVCDLNGIFRGKRFPAGEINKLLEHGSRMPLSTCCIDIWGDDLIDSPFLFESGDADGIVKSTGATLIPINWLDRPTALLPSWMSDDRGNPSPIDPRQILCSVLERYGTMGLKPMIAFELEFYLLDSNFDKLTLPKNPITSNRLQSTSVLSIDELDSFETFFSDVYSACKDHNIPSDTAISENAVGQFEINLKHTSESLRAADQALFFKRIVKGVAQKHGMRASFMAKPFLETAGSGMHLHMSIIDKDGKNIFDTKTQFGLKKLKNAVGGLLNALEESTLIFAPHLNSYRRLKPGSHAPTAICWGYENRTASIRIPGGKSENKRIEHRVAGADANPYLVASAVLSAALDGIQRNAKAPSPVKGDSYQHKFRQIPTDWQTAIDAFKSGVSNKNFYSDVFVQVFSSLKSQELRTFTDRMEDFEIATYSNSF